MDEIRQTQKRYCSKAMILAILIGLAFFIFNQKSIGKGLILGTIFSSINFVLIGEFLPLKTGKSKNKIFLLSLGSIAFRFIILAIPLIIGIKYEAIHLAGAVCGIFMVQMVILAEHLYQMIMSIRQ